MDVVKKTTFLIVDILGFQGFISVAILLLAIIIKIITMNVLAIQNIGNNMKSRQMCRDIRHRVVVYNKLIFHWAHNPEIETEYQLIEV